MPAEPTYRPLAHHGEADVKQALKRMSEFLAEGGEWSADLVVFMDAWLDHALQRGFKLKDRKKAKKD